LLPLLLCIHSSGARTTDAFQLLAPNPVENILRTTSSGVIPECRKKENPQRGGNRERKQSPTKNNGSQDYRTKTKYRTTKNNDIVKSIVQTHAQQYVEFIHTQPHTQKDMHTHTQIHTQIHTTTSRNTYSYTPANTYSYTSTNTSHIHPRTHTHINPRTHTHIHDTHAHSHELSLFLSHTITHLWGGSHTHTHTHKITHIYTTSGGWEPGDIHELILKPPLAFIPTLGSIQAPMLTAAPGLY
jgi:hypothetical protein